MRHETLYDALKGSYHGHWGVLLNSREDFECGYSVTHPLKHDELSQYEPSQLWYTPNYASGSDYSGSAVERSNYNILSEYKCNKISTHKDMCSSYSISFRGDLRNTEIVEILKALENYPVIDEQEMSNVESQWQTAYWEDFSGDLASTLEGMHPAIAEIDLDTLMTFIYYIDCQGNGWDWEYCGTGATLINEDETLAKSKVDIPTLISKGVVFTLADDYEDYLTSFELCQLYKAAASYNVELKTEDGTLIIIPDWSYYSPNQIKLFQD